MNEDKSFEIFVVICQLLGVLCFCMIFVYKPVFEFIGKYTSNEFLVATTFIVLGIILSLFVYFKKEPAEGFSIIQFVATSIVTSFGLVLFSNLYPFEKTKTIVIFITLLLPLFTLLFRVWKSSVSNSNIKCIGEIK